MIVDFFIGLMAGLWGWILSLIPSDSTFHLFIEDGADFLGSIFLGAHQLGAWLPWDILFLSVSIVFAVYTVTLLAKLGLRILSHIPMVGGSG